MLNSIKSKLKWLYGLDNGESPEDYLAGFLLLFCYPFNVLLLVALIFCTDKDDWKNIGQVARVMFAYLATLILIMGLIICLTK